MMNIIKTTAPFSMEHLKMYFINKEIRFIVDYDASELKGQKLLTYLSNVDIPCDIEFAQDQSLYEMVREYLLARQIVSVQSLEQATISLLLQHKGIISAVNTTEVEHLRPLLDKWSEVLDSMVLYNMYTINSDDIKQWVKQHPENTSDTTEGINFVNMLKHEHFFMFYEKLDTSKLQYFSKYFNEYMFRGQSLFKYWANSNNPMFLLTTGIASGVINNKQYVDAIKASIPAEEITL